MQLKLKKRDVLLFIPIVIIAAFFLYNTSWSEAIGKDWQPCLDYFAKGELYQGQLICPYGPVYFGIGYLFKLIFNDFYQIALRLFLLILFIYTIYLLARISQDETSKKYYLIIVLLSLLWIYPQTVAAKPEKAFAVFFTFFGFYFLYYTNFKFKEIISATFFSLGMYSSFNPAPLIAVIVVIYSLKLELVKFEYPKVKIKFDFAKQKTSKFLILVFSLIIIFILVKLLYPNFLAYSLFSHATAYEKYNLPLVTVLKEFLPGHYMPVVLFLIYIILIICLLAFISTKKHIPIIGFLGVVGIVISYKMGLGEFQFGRMVAPAIPFIILSIILAINYVKKQTYGRLALYLSLIFLVIFPGYEINLFNGWLYDKVNISLRNLQKEIGYGVHFLPPNKTVLVQYKEILTKYDYKTDNIDVVEGGISLYTPVDSFSGRGLLKQGFGNESLWYSYTPPELIEKQLKEKESLITETGKKIVSGKYDIIVWHAEEGKTVIEYSIEEVKKKYNIDVKRVYLPMSLPNLDQKAVYSEHASILLFKDDGEAVRTSVIILKYYSEIFDHVCKKSLYLSEEVIRNVLSATKFITNTGGEIPLDINKKCENGGSLYNSFESYVLFGEHFLIIILITLATMIIYIPHLKQNNKLTSKKEKIIYYGIIAIVIILSVYTIFLINNDLGYYLEIAKHIL